MEKLVEVPVDRIVEVERVVEVPVSRTSEFTGTSTVDNVSSTEFLNTVERTTRKGGVSRGETRVASVEESAEYDKQLAASGTQQDDSEASTTKTGLFGNNSLANHLKKRFIGESSESNRQSSGGY